MLVKVFTVVIPDILAHVSNSVHLFTDDCLKHQHFGLIATFPEQVYDPALRVPC